MLGMAVHRVALQTGSWRLGMRKEMQMVLRREVITDLELIDPERQDVRPVSAILVALGSLVLVGASVGLAEFLLWVSG